MEISPGKTFPLNYAPILSTVLLEGHDSAPTRQQTELHDRLGKRIFNFTDYGLIDPKAAKWAIW
jgi:hypothetical protein